MVVESVVRPNDTRLLDILALTEVKLVELRFAIVALSGIIKVAGGAATKTGPPPLYPLLPFSPFDPYLLLDLELKRI